MTTEADIVAQCWTLFYRWASDPSNDRLARSQNKLFSMLQDLDPAAHAEVFNAAVAAQDFPADISRKYPGPLKPSA